MKIRSGFVSNSSSTSFTLFGIFVDEKFTKKYGTEVKKCADEWGLKVYHGDWPQYIGLIESGTFEYDVRSDMSDDETRNQFVERVTDSFPEELQDEAGWHSESYYDG